MSHLPLWGTWPIWFFISLWVLIALWIGPWWIGRKDFWPAFREMGFFGMAATLAFPPFDLFPLAFVAWLPVLKWLGQHDRGEMSSRGLAGRSFLAFFLWNGLATYWIINTSFIPGLVAFLMNAFFMMIILWWTGRIRRIQHPRFRDWILPAAWISFEMLHHHWELAWPWLSLGNSLADQIGMIQWYSWTGMFGGTLWILVMNLLFYRLQTSGEASAKGLVRIALMFGVPVLFSMILFLGYREKGDPVDVVVVQPNFEPHYEKFFLPTDVQIDRFIELSESSVDSLTDYLVFPETSFTIRDVSRMSQFRPFIRLREMLRNYPGLTLVTGFDGYRFHPPSDDHLREVRSYAANGGDTIYYAVLNAALDMNASSNDSVNIYLKSKLVPGPEIFPYGKLLFFLKPVIDMLQGTLTHFAMQPERSTLGRPDEPVAPVICYESVFGEYNSGYVSAGAKAIFIMTNDGWWDNTPGHQQHLAFARMRAIEQRRSIARSANTGISCFIDQHGRVFQKTRYGEATAIRRTMLFNDGKTLYQRTGDVIARAALLMLILFSVGAFFRKK